MMVRIAMSLVWLRLVPFVRTVMMIRMVMSYFGCASGLNEKIRSVMVNQISNGLYASDQKNFNLHILSYCLVF